MVNPVKGEVPLKLADGRELTLVLDMEAMIVAEELYRKPVEYVLADAMVGFTGALRAILYGMLRAHHSEVTPSEALEMFVANKEVVARAFEQASKAAKASKDGEDKERPGPRQRGASSGRSGAKQDSTRKASGGQPRARSKSRSAPS